MNREKEMIATISKHMPKSPDQVNKLFESDSEIIVQGNLKIAYNIDEFSEEDLLRDHDPYILGWNVAVGCLSDILASGAIPKYYAHSFVAKKTWTKEYVEKMSLGIGDVLRKAGAAFIGGDFGVSELWRYTGSSIGEAQGQPLLRSGAECGDIIFISGRIGMGNIEAALKLYSENIIVRKIADQYKNQFHLRVEEAQLIREFSSCCIDTSDGVLNALQTISAQSKTGYKVWNLPYERSGIALAKLLGLPKELLFCGECGEYELLFTIHQADAEEFRRRAEKMELTFYEIGEIQGQGVQLLEYKNNNSIDFSSYNLSARDYEDQKEYLRDVIERIRS